MQQLKKSALALVAGGEAVLADQSDDFTVDTDSIFAHMGGGSGGSGGGGGGGGFDSNGVGPNSCVAAPHPTEGLFGMTLTETLTAATGVAALTGGIGQGVGASLAIETAGGLAGVGEMGASAAGLIGSAALGVGSAGLAGYAVGSVAYYNSETVQDVSQAVVGRVIEVGGDAPATLGTAVNALFSGQAYGRAGVGP